MPDGSIKYVHMVSHGLRDDLGNLEFVGSVMDVTAAKRAYREIQALKDQLHKENLALKEEIDRSSMFEEIVGLSCAARRAGPHRQGGADRLHRAHHRETGTGRNSSPVPFTNDRRGPREHL